MEDCEHSGHYSSCCTDKNVEKFAKLSTMTSDNVIIHWQVRTPVWNMPLNSKGGLEHVALVSGVCAFVHLHCFFNAGF